MAVLFFPGYEQMQIVPQKIGAVHASMSVKDTKVSCFFPVYVVLGLRNSQNYRHSVLVVLSHRALISGSCESLYIAIRFVREFGWLEVGDR